jgi:hypothetical protein
MPIAALRRLSVPFLAVAVTIGLLALSSGESKAQWIPNTPQFQPVFDAKLCNDLGGDFSGPSELKGGGGACTPDTSPGGHPDITTPFTVPQGNLAYNQSFFAALGGANETRLDGAAIGGPNADGTGAAGGGLESTVTLGLAANPCNNTIYPDFIWWEAEYDVTDTVACAPEGTDDRWNNMASDGGDAWHGQADNDSPIVTGFPDCIVRMLDPDGDGIDTDSDPGTIDDQPVQPRARFAGLTQVPPGGDYQMLNNIEFDPGDLQKAFMANTNTTKHPFAKLDPLLGFVNLVVLNDPTTVILQPNPISDFCTLLGTKGMLKGVIDTGSGTVNRVTSPATPGSYQVQMRTQSYRDADGDGLQNDFDTCAWTANTAAQDPYSSSGPDTDMLDSVCDPTPGAKNDDEDGDGYLNNQDYCPLVANPLNPSPPPPGGETDAENTQPYNTSAPDGGPRQDQIGDDCDSENGGNDLVTNGLYFNAVHVDSVAITGGGVVDGDSDGWGSDADPDDADADNPGQLVHWQVDDSDKTADTDGDGATEYTDWIEWVDLGTDPRYSCPMILGHDAWPPDFDTNRVINITDVFRVLPPIFGSSCGQPNFSIRADLDPNCVINITDVFKVLPPIFGTSCP